MSYDLKPVKVPRLAGWKLGAFVRALENDMIRRALMPRLFREAGIDRFQRMRLGDQPSFYPVCPSGSPIGEAEAKESLGVLQAHPPWITKGKGFSRRTIYDYAAAYGKNRTNPREVAGRVLRAIEASNGGNEPLRSVIDWDPEDLMRQARDSTERFRKGTPLGVLDGVPVAVKDELDQVPYKTRVGTSFLGETPAREDATPVARLREAGALLIGKTNMHEIGIGVTGINPHFGAARNPFDPDRYTGGSSSGSAAAVAAGLCPVAMGADGGGSIRIPASLCGVVGLKATWGRVSEFGAAPLCWTVAHVGPLGATVMDTALAYAIIAGPDPKDSFSLGHSPPHLIGIDNDDLGGIVVGIFTPWFQDADPEIVAACERARRHLEAKGARVCEIELPELDLARIAHNVTIGSEMAANMEQHYQEDPTRFGLDVRVNLAICREFTNRDYVKAQRVRTRLLESFRGIYEKVDVVITPSTGCTAPLIRKDALPDGESDLSTLAAIIRFATPANLTGWPAISVPVGYDCASLPIGLQIMGRPWEEHILFRLGRVVEREAEHRRPKVYFDLLPD